MAARRKSGFTLIELLVVIAIIAILAAILFPVFARAREAARKSNCQSNMKECAIALQTYWNDYDATLPSSKNSTITALAWSQTEYQAYTFYAGATTASALLNPVSWYQKLYNCMKNKDICFCPSDSENRDAGNPPGSAAMLSYWWKAAIDRAWSDLKCQKEGQFGYNADQIVFFERGGFHEGQGNTYYNGVKINVAFLDSHVRNVSLINTPYQTKAAAASFLTNVAAGCGSNGEPNYFNFDNEQAKVVNTNPPAPGTAVTPGGSPNYAYLDPRRYSDILP